MGTPRLVVVLLVLAVAAPAGAQQVGMDPFRRGTSFGFAMGSSVDEGRAACEAAGYAWLRIDGDLYQCTGSAEGGTRPRRVTFELVGRRTYALTLTETFETATAADAWLASASAIWAARFGRAGDDVACTEGAEDVVCASRRWSLQGGTAVLARHGSVWIYSLQREPDFAAADTLQILAGVLAGVGTAVPAIAYPAMWATGGAPEFGPALVPGVIGLAALIVSIALGVHGSIVRGRRPRGRVVVDGEVLELRF